MDASDHGLELSVFGVGLLMCLVCSPLLGRWVWLNTLPVDSPTTVITDREVEHHGRNSTTVTTYIEVAGVEYPCRGGAMQHEGDLVSYDPSTPSRCIDPARAGQLGATRLMLLVFLAGLGAMVYAVVSFFFLTGGREQISRGR